MNKKKDLSQEDKKTWEDYIKDPSDIYDKDRSNQKSIIRGEVDDMVICSTINYVLGDGTRQTEKNKIVARTNEGRKII